MAVVGSDRKLGRREAAEARVRAVSIAMGTPALTKRANQLCRWLASIVSLR